MTQTPLTLSASDEASVCLDLHQAILDGLADVPPLVRRRAGRVHERLFAQAHVRAEQDGLGCVVIVNETDAGEVARWNFPECVRPA